MVTRLRRFVNIARPDRKNQCRFWSRFGATQSRGSRFEMGSAIPTPVAILLRLYLDGVITDNDQRHRAPHSLNVSRIRHDVAQVKRLPRPALQNPSARLKAFRKDALPCAVHLGISVPKNIDKSSMPQYPSPPSKCTLPWQSKAIEQVHQRCTQAA